nr:nuclear pore complex protein NUP43-like [Ziziphus jujuba var. spinosa]
MAVTALSESPQVHRFPQSKYVDAVRWLPPVLPLKRFAVVAFFNTDSDSDPYFIEIQSLSSNPLNLNSHSSWVSPSRISSLKTSQSHYVPLVVAGTFAGSLHVLSAGSVDGASLEPVLSVPEKVMHNGPVSCLDLMDGGVECVIVGEDGRVNLVSIGDSRLNHRRVFDSSGLVSYTAAKWGSPTEFATGGYGYSLQWWDQRKPDGAVSQFKGSWAQRKTSGIVHSIDIHPSRKHTCLAGGSLGTVFAWDLRWPQQPIVLSGLGAGNTEHSPSESEVWEVQYDRFAKSSNVGNISSSRILPAMICSEDGILSVVEQGEEPIELLAEPCAINSFDIDRQNPSDVICSLEWESIAILTRPKNA